MFARNQYYCNFNTIDKATQTRDRFPGEMQINNIISHSLSLFKWISLKRKCTSYVLLIDFLEFHQNIQSQSNAGGVWPLLLIEVQFYWI